MRMTRHAFGPLATRRFQVLFSTALMRGCPYLSEDGIARFAAWAREASTVDETAIYSDGSEFVSKMRAVAACLPDQAPHLLVAQMSAIVDNRALYPESIARVLYPTRDRDVVARLRAALRAVWAGESQRAAAEASGVSLRMLSAALVWLGTDAALADRTFDTAVSLASSGGTAADIQAAVGCSTSTAGRLLLQARGVLAELAR